MKNILLSGIKVEYTQFGNGFPLLFLHGGSVSSRSSMPFMQTLSQRFNVWTISLPGAGRSSNIPRNWKFYNYGDIAVEFVRKMSIKPILAGHSLGGAVSIVAKSKSVGSFKKLVLLSSGGIPNPEHKVVIREVVKEKLKTLLRGKGYERRDLLINLGFHLRDMLKMAEMFKALDLRENLKRINEKVTVIWGKDDPVIPVKYADEFGKYLKNAEIYKLNDAGHGHEALLNSHAEEIVEIVNVNV